VTAVLDGEAVVLDDQGRSDFNALLKSLGGRSGKRPAREVMLYAFDLLYLDGHDLRRMELTERRNLLENLIMSGDLGSIRLSEEIEAEGQVFFDLACEHGLEGIVAKRRDRPYRSGRSGDWLKIKCIRRDSFIVVGYETSGQGGINKLLLAGRKDANDLVYVGSVGTGFSGVASRTLRGILDQLKVDAPPIAMKTGARVLFAQPTLIVDVEYRAWTADGKLRHSAYKGLSEMQDNAAIFRIDPSVDP
jgi:bifunctional non-homologous end joining protein LigD